MSEANNGQDEKREHHNHTPIDHDDTEEQESAHFQRVINALRFYRYDIIVRAYFWNCVSVSLTQSQTQSVLPVILYDIHIRPTGPNGNRGKLILLFVYGSRFTIVFQVARRCASASMSANGIVGQSMRRLPSGYWVPFTVRAIRARRTTLLSGMRRMCPRYRNLRCRIARTRSNTYPKASPGHTKHCIQHHTTEYNSTQQHTTAYNSTQQHTPAYNVPYARTQVVPHRFDNLKKKN